MSTSRFSGCGCRLDESGKVAQLCPQHRCEHEKQRAAAVLRIGLSILAEQSQTHAFRCGAAERAIEQALAVLERQS